MDKTFKKLLQLLLPYWPAMLGAGLLGAFTIASNIGLLATSAVLISQAALIPPLMDLMVLIVGVRFFGISRGVLRYTERYVTHDITFRILKKLRVWFYHQLEPLAPASLQNYSSGRLWKQIIGDVEALKFFYLRVLAAPLVALLVLIGSSLLLSRYSPNAALVLIFFFLLGGVMVPLVVKEATRGLAAQQSQGQELFHTRMVDYIQGQEDLQISGGVEKAQQEIHSLLDRLTNIQKKNLALDNLTTNLLQYFSQTALLAGLFLTVPLVTSGQLDGIYLAMIPLILWSSFEAILPLPLALKQLEEGLTAARNLFSLNEVLTESHPELHAQHTIESPQEPILPHYGITFENVSFCYRKEESFRLDNLSLEIPSGSKTAIVGSSGAGKSTLINLLLQFWPYEEGNIFLGGSELKEFSGTESRNLLGVLNQQPYIFHTTIRENILLARPEASVEELEEACRLAKIYDFILSLPEKYETSVGEGGFKLSGGQRQRLALARIFLKNSPILLLDEGTQKLDTLTGQEIIKTLESWWKDKTILFITHTLQGLESMDQILVMDQGQIVERGTHQSLLAQEGYYAKLWYLEKSCL